MKFRSARLGAADRPLLGYGVLVARGLRLGWSFRSPVDRRLAPRIPDRVHPDGSRPEPATGSVWWAGACRRHSAPWILIFPRNAGNIGAGGPEHYAAGSVGSTSDLRLPGLRRKRGQTHEPALPDAEPLGLSARSRSSRPERTYLLATRSGAVRWTWRPVERGVILEALHLGAGCGPRCYRFVPVRHAHAQPLRSDEKMPGGDAKLFLHGRQTGHALALGRRCTARPGPRRSWS